MKTVWVSRQFDAPALLLWRLLVDLDAWPKWGPSVRHAEMDSDVLAMGTRGTVTTSVGVTVPFEITRFDDGRSWSWRVAGVEATDHRVEAMGPDRCRVGFGVAWPAAPYLVVCRTALTRLAALAATQQAGHDDR